jgi:hypothetical protein
LICEYCGLASRRAEDPRLEREALDEFQLLLRRCEPDAQSKLLREGFLPSSAAGLIEAAALCLEFIDRNNVGEPGPSAMGRLDAILARLSVLPASDAVTRALATYRERIESVRREERSSLVGGLIGFGVIALAVIAGIFWFAWSLLG